MSAYGTEKGKRYLHRRRRPRRRAARHKTTRTKELRRCTIRAHDGRMKIGGWLGGKEGGRNSKTSDVLRRCCRDSRESTGYTKDRRKEVLLRGGTAGDAGGDTRGMGGGVFCLSDIKEPVANFLPSARPASSLTLFLPRALPAARHTSRRSYAVVFHPPAYTRTHDAFQAGVPKFRVVV